MNWYIVQAYSGFENKVADSIKDIMSKSSLESNLGEILVPTQKVVEVKKGKRKICMILSNSSDKMIIPKDKYIVEIITSELTNLILSLLAIGSLRDLRNQKRGTSINP